MSGDDTKISRHTVAKLHLDNVAQNQLFCFHTEFLVTTAYNSKLQNRGNSMSKRLPAAPSSYFGSNWIFMPCQPHRITSGQAHQIITSDSQVLGHNWFVFGYFRMIYQKLSGQKPLHVFHVCRILPFHPPICLCTDKSNIRHGRPQPMPKMVIRWAGWEGMGVYQKGMQKKSCTQKTYRLFRDRLYHSQPSFGSTLCHTGEGFSQQCQGVF